MENAGSDGELMAAVGNGDREAFGCLVDRHKDAVVGYLARLVRDRDRADDLAQETFVRLFQSAGRYRDEGRLRPFLYRIATNLAWSEERRARRHRLFLGLVGRNGHGPEPPDVSALEGERRQLVALALARLPVHFRAPLVLHEIEGLAYEDVARVLGCREGTVKSRISRARAHLRTRLAPFLGEHGR